MYSCTSVCSWLLIRTSLCPVALASRSTMDVFPADVGPCKSTGCLRAATMRASVRRRSEMVGVTMYRGSCGSTWYRGSVRNQNPPTSTQSSSPCGFGGALADGVMLQLRDECHVEGVVEGTVEAVAKGQRARDVGEGAAERA
eukprot:5805829-Pleurochrysis_carterae.AAC.1